MRHNLGTPPGEGSKTQKELREESQLNSRTILQTRGGQFFDQFPLVAGERFGDRYADLDV